MVTFSYQAPGERRDIYIMDADGSNRLQLTSDPSTEEESEFAVF